ncbi:hypothetical protein BC835DRAFT_832613 [Cytidiella melzeri]|nr:hypothetical protein BC835DRAFT_832613 [Cytidiella melzeri]
MSQASAPQMTSRCKGIIYALQMASRSAAQQNASTAEQRAQNPAPKTYRCSRFLCAYENPPQVAWGKFQCAAIYGGQRCTGTFEVSPKDAYSWHQTCLEDIARGDAEKEREMERRLAREARIHENEETIWKPG